MYRKDNLLFIFPLDRHTHTADCRNFRPFNRDFKMKEYADTTFKAPVFGKRTKFIIAPKE